MRPMPALTLLMLLGLPALAAGQAFDVHGSGGPTLVDRGYSLASGIGWLPLSHLQVGLNAERTHLPLRVRGDALGTSVFRGGTLTVGTIEAQVSLRARDRVTPYLLAGVAAGTSRPNVNERFPNAVRNDVRALFAGGGVLVPVRPALHLFADVRWMVGAEANEILAVAPLRAGLSWRF